MIQMDRGDRLRMTLLDRMSSVENGPRSVTLEDILMAETSSSRSRTTPPSPPARHQSNSSLHDVLRRERRRNQTAWKSLRDKLRLKRTTTGWISSNPLPPLDNPIPNLDNESHRLNRLGFLFSNSEINQNNGSISHRGEEAAEREGRRRLGTVLLAEREEMQPPRMSLMELLEDNDGQIYNVSEREVVAVKAEVVAEAEAAEGKEGCGERGKVTEEVGCCVCMIRSKGAAFIPCGHTFCRLCSRELWVQRGNCPLCNTSILQVLDIF